MDFFEGFEKYVFNGSFVKILDSSRLSKRCDEIVGIVGSLLIGIFDHLTYSACIIVKLTTTMMRLTVARENTLSIVLKNPVRKYLTRDDLSLTVFCKNVPISGHNLFSLCFCFKLVEYVKVLFRAGSQLRLQCTTCSILSTVKIQSFKGDQGLKQELLL